MFREGLAALIGGRPGVTQVRAVASGGEALAAAEADPPDIAVVDLRMPDGDGVWLTAALVERFPTIRVLVLTSADDQELGPLQALAQHLPRECRVVHDEHTYRGHV